MIEVPEFPLDIHRGDTRPLAFEFRTGVNTTVPAELTGSSFELRFSDALGARVLTVGGTIADRVVVFGLTLEQRALLAPGSSGTVRPGAAD